MPTESSVQNPKSAARTVMVTEANAGQRLDNFLLLQLKGVPRAHVYRLLRTGQVRVNGGRTKPLYRLKMADQVRLPPVRLEERHAHQVDTRLLETLQNNQLYEDDDLLVLNKPGGVAVHGGSGLKGGVIETLKAAREGFLELAHRLDRETSGCLLLAKNRPTLVRLHAQLQQGEIRKRYVALVLGQWRGGAQRVEQSLKRTRGERQRKVSVDEDGKAAISEFKLRQAYGGYSLLEVEIHTGRTHQIRVHAQELGFPLAGDSRYGDRQTNRELRKLGLKRQFLHAESLQVPRPEQKKLKLTAPLPDDLQSVLVKLQATFS